MLIFAVNHGSVNFWIGSGAFDVVAFAASVLLARRSRAMGRMDRYKRYSAGAWAFFAYAALCGARIILLT